MQFGIFDHLDDSGAPLAEVYAQRLALVEAYESAGLHGYHLAEHHYTPLGQAPSPSLFLAAAAQRTRRILLGPLVYTLALYHPLRLADEICMLDHLSNGRLQLGIGRGASPYEMAYLGVAREDMQPMYLEAYRVVMQALTAERVDFEGRYYRFRDVPVRLRPLQRPHPPLWYGLGNPESAEWAAQTGLNIVCLSQPLAVRAITDRYRAEWKRLGRDPLRLPRLGMTRHLVIAESDAQARDIARRAYRRWHASFWSLWLKHDAHPRFAGYADGFDEIARAGLGIAGSPASVREAIASQLAASGINYLLLDVAFGDLSPAESLRTVELFTKEVLPAFAARA